MPVARAIFVRMEPQTNHDSIRILVIEDEPSMLFCVEQILKRHYEVIPVSDCLSGERILESRPIEILICDENLPGENGLMFMARIRDRFPDLQMILMTGQASEELLAQAINEVQVLRFLPKPFGAETLIRFVREAADRHLQVQTSKDMPAQTRSRLGDAMSTLLRGSLQLSAIWTVFALLILPIGVFSLILLYALKTFLGIDVFQGWHATDWMR